MDQFTRKLRAAILAPAALATAGCACFGLSERTREADSALCIAAYAAAAGVTIGSILLATGGSDGSTSPGLE